MNAAALNNNLSNDTQHFQNIEEVAAAESYECIIDVAQQINLPDDNQIDDDDYDESAYDTEYLEMDFQNIEEVAGAELYECKIDVPQQNLVELTDDKAPDADIPLENAGLIFDDANNLVDLFQYEKSVPELESFQFQGKRIVDLPYFFEQVQAAAEHSKGFDCGIKYLIPINEHQNGLCSKLFFKCTMCNTKIKLETSQNGKKVQSFDINQALAIGASSIGCGFSQMEQLFSTLDVPFMSHVKYQNTEDETGEYWKDTASAMMVEAAKEEAEAAIQRGDIDPEDSVPFITVIADACWSKRSYGKNYNALSGAAAIVGLHTKKVLYMDTKNKYCWTCMQHDGKDNEPIKDHICNKNFVGPSTAMEAALIVEGFQTSVKTNNLRYMTLIADGDSSVYKQVLDAKPYQHRRIQKLECRNHLLRNFRNKLDEEVNKIRHQPEAKNFLKTNLERIRKGISSAIKFRIQEQVDGTTTKEEAITNIKLDIENSIHHVCGDHVKCPKYLKNRCKVGEPNKIPELKRTRILEKLMIPTRRLVYNAKSLFEFVTNNPAEQYNAIVAKFVGGKRINFSKKQGYSNRCSAAVVQYNTSRPFYNLHKIVHESSPTTRVKRLELKRLSYNTRRRQRIRCARNILMKRKRGTSMTNSYGQNCLKPDLSPEDYCTERRVHMSRLAKFQLRRYDIERNTQSQSECDLWHEIREIMLTASNFGTVCRALKLKGHTKTIVHNQNIFTKAVEHGKVNEDVARKQLEVQMHLKIDKSGIHIDAIESWLAASPDGLINDDGILEIKCPYSAFGSTVLDGINKGAIKYLHTNSEKTVITGLKKNHPYYYQVQGQLHITQRKYCLFAVWTSSTEELYVENIERDEDFWKDKMYTKLRKFYFNWMMPEIIDSRFRRGMEIEERYHMQ